MGRGASRSLRVAAVVALVIGYVIVARTVSVDERPPETPYAGTASSTPPPTRADPQVDVLHGIAVRDPHRWLENADDPRVRAWIEAQNTYTQRVLRRLGLRDRVRQLRRIASDPESVRSLDVGDRIFYVRRREQPKEVLYALDAAGAESVLLDCNLEPGLTFDSLWPSRDGRHVACALARSGSDEMELRVIDVETRTAVPDELGTMKYASFAWDAAGRGFWYTRVEPHPQLLYHRVGTSTREDEIVFERRESRRWNFTVELTRDGRWLCVVVVDPDRGDAVYVRDEARPRDGFRPLVTAFRGSWTLLGNDGTTLWFQTTYRAGRGRIVAIDLDDASRRVVSVVPERAPTILEAKLGPGRFIVHDLDDGASRLRLFSLDGTFAEEIKLPDSGTVRAIQARPDRPSMEFSFESWVRPPVTLVYDFEKRRAFELGATGVSTDPGVPIVERREYPSSGTMVPITIVRPADAENGPRPTLLYVYGGFNLALTPAYHWPAQAWVEAGGVFAVAHVRGGGFRGPSWYQAGRRLEKQKTFDDFIAAAEWLVETGVTTRRQLAIRGESNGGLVVGACLVQRPELFGAVLCERGVLDMVRYDRVGAGHYWLTEYGDPRQKDDFDALIAYSPVHHVKPGTRYPPTMITTGLADDRVDPMHSYKFAAALQAAQSADAPIVLRVQWYAGHAGGRTGAIDGDELLDAWTFLMSAVGLDPGG